MLSIYPSAHALNWTAAENKAVMKVLYVEDESSLREEVSLILEMENFQVETAENGLQGLERLDSF